MTTFACSRCGHHNPSYLSECERCRTPRAPQPYAAPPQSGAPYPPTTAAYPAQAGPAMSGQGYPPAMSPRGYPPAMSPQGYPPAMSPQGYPPAMSPQGYPPAMSPQGSSPGVNAYPPPPGVNGYPSPAMSAGGPTTPTDAERAAIAARLPPTPPEVEKLVYSSELVIPAICACCAGTANTTVETQAVGTGGRRISWFKFPHCKACARHMAWSGKPGTGPVRMFAALFMAAGVLGGLALGDTGTDSTSRGIMVAVFAGMGFVGAMIFVAIFGGMFAPRTPACSARGSAVGLTRAPGGYQFRFSNRLFDQVFRSLNKGNPAIDMQALVRSLSQRK